jgi:hypothetical protein
MGHLGLRPNGHVRFLATLESTGEFVVRSHQPLVDGARELLARGYEPTTPLTMRHEGKAYDASGQHRSASGPGGPTLRASSTR